MNRENPSAWIPLYPTRQDCEVAQPVDVLRERTLADNMSQLAWTASPRGQVQWYNERWYAYTGTTLEAMVALGWRSVVHPEHRERVMARLQYCFATGSVWEDTFALRGKDGAFNWFLSRALPMRDAQGHITHWLGTHTDITAQVNAEEALRELNESLELRVADRTRELAKANELLQVEIAERAQAEEVLRHAQKMDAIGQLTGGIAHDFNNMLSGVLGALEMIRLRMGAQRFGEVDRYVDAAVSSANRAAALTQRLLTFARRQSLSVGTVDINCMVRSMEELLRGTVGNHAQLHVELEEGLSAIQTDEHQLENALLNLVINARDAVPVAGLIRVRSQALRLVAQDGALAAGDYVRLSVEDNGCGIAQDVIDRVFDPFFTTKPVGQGTGLGLSMVYGFIKQTGGHVQIKSEQGQGTRICLYLPCDAATA
ncbi:hybrid sensor histidine kinase/response regulator [Pseudomonas avellanae]|uniref:histidine kinase n=1 Tax=Pseudomonas avellanae TaxID=46257 RepID=A0A3M5T943_9PSED|nr:PAS domain-containing hybrid sensor histidine kinase/response regulator [Pseudomonas avellanae]EKG31670.1 sensor y box histidine kinase [Pseudomonas avellanae BPIC 631]RMU30100.1 Sensor y box histidine kinase [Pseudomonas avellanae]UQW69711.1 ATP-binding protein [Pseudomonas avellanae]GGJ11122.1 PAS domain-containing sensor histidine kinase [Pseudomonas avellanae]